jgi:hypothetical protein
MLCYYPIKQPLGLSGGIALSEYSSLFHLVLNDYPLVCVLLLVEDRII